MKRIFPLLILACSLFSITFYSCKKQEPDTEAQSAVDNSICEGEFSRIQGVVSDYGIREKGIKSLTRSGCVNLTADTTDPFIRYLQLDFGDGTSPCQGADGKYRSGIIHAKFYGKWSDPSAKMTIWFVNYKVGNVQYNADSITVNRNPSSNFPSFTTTVHRGTCTTNNWNLEWAGTRTMTQIAGAATDTVSSDDVFEFTGNASGVNRNGKGYTSSISIPIQKRADCNWINMGRLDLTPDGLATRTIDYGNGNCDNEATLSINGNVYTFKLD